MKTTLQLDENLVRAAKKRALDEGRTLTAVIRDALHHYLAPPPPRRGRFRLRLLIRKGRRLPGVNLADRDALYEVMDGRR